MRTESVRPLETDCLRVPDTSTLISYLRRARIALKRTIQRGSGGGAKSRRTWGFLWEFDGVKPRPSIYGQTTAILSGTCLSERPLESDDERKLGFWRELSSEIIRRLPVSRCVVPSHRLFSDGLTGQRCCPPATSRAIAGETARASLP
jgi:hypothetical protein